MGTCKGDIFTNGGENSFTSGGARCHVLLVPKVGVSPICEMSLLNKKYICLGLQRLSTQCMSTQGIFRPLALMNNILRVMGHL